MRGHHQTVEDDGFIPRPVWFARQLGWCVGSQDAWGWDQLLKVAAKTYWLNKPTAEQESTRAV